MSTNNLFKFSERSEKNLNGVHPDLVKVVHLTLYLTHTDFIVIEGIRTAEKQKKMVNDGHSQTLNSRHLTGHAVDLVPLINGMTPWDNWSAFAELANTAKQAAQHLNIPIIWGGDWISLKDGPHFELSRQHYP
ncbi:peptidase M15 family [Yersinia pekkanenii]|uniref:Peptidase M15 family n=2 Tax=Yersinia pekkanenii TaxID=1288385 RepID=A0A0T9PM48_9GAMM|nr:peptidase M15 family [Yersinia pekkanenii]CRY68069.1 peptidase M15 family [Yersinia pekkanenii]